MTTANNWRPKEVWQHYQWQQRQPKQQQQRPYPKPSIFTIVEQKAGSLCTYMCAVLLDMCAGIRMAPATSYVCWSWPHVYYVYAVCAVVMCMWDVFQYRWIRLPCFRVQRTFFEVFRLYEWATWAGLGTFGFDSCVPTLSCRIIDWIVSLMGMKWTNGMPVTVPQQRGLSSS